MKKNAAPKISELVISKKDVVGAIPHFVEGFRRLPYMREDNIMVEVEQDNGEITRQPYSALKYIEAYFETAENFTGFLLTEEVLSLKSMGEIMGIDPSRLDRLLKNRLKNITKRERRKLELFFNDDIYKNEGSEYAQLCSTCKYKNKCGQPYWVGSVSCTKYDRE